MEKLERDLAQRTRENISLQNQVSILTADKSELHREMGEMRRELAELRRWRNEAMAR